MGRLNNCIFKWEETFLSDSNENIAKNLSKKTERDQYITTTMYKMNGFEQLKMVLQLKLQSEIALS